MHYILLSKNIVIGIGEGGPLGSAEWGVRGCAVCVCVCVCMIQHYIYGAPPPPPPHLAKSQHFDVAFYRPWKIVFETDVFLCTKRTVCFVD